MRTINDERPEPEAADQVFEVAEVEHDSGDAILVVMHEDGDKRWIPKSVVHSSSVVQGVGDCGPLTLHAWWLKAHSDEWGHPGSPKGKPGTGKAIGVSDLGQVQKLLQGKGIDQITFGRGRVVLGTPSGTYAGRDLVEAVRTLDRARRE